MTDKLTLTPEHFSVESGFAEGVVVEVNLEGENYLGYFADVAGPHLRLKHQDGEAHQSLHLGFIKSLTILTGPMRFWSGAPGWAKRCFFDLRDGSVQFDDNKVLPVSNGSIVATRRPFWCDFGKEE